MIPGLHCSPQSVQAPPLSLLDLELRRAIKKTPEMPARWKTTGRKFRNYTPQISPPGGRSATSKMPQKR